MIQLVEKDENTTRTYVQQLKQRCDEKDRKVDAIVADILENVRNNGDKAVAEYTLKFDGSIPEQVEITKEQMKELIKQCDAYFLEALERAAKNLHEFQLHRIMQHTSGKIEIRYLQNLIHIDFQYAANQRQNIKRGLCIPIDI